MEKFENCKGNQFLSRISCPIGLVHIITSNDKHNHAVEIINFKIGETWGNDVQHMPLTQSIIMIFHLWTMFLIGSVAKCFVYRFYDKTRPDFLTNTLFISHQAVHHGCRFMLTVIFTMAIVLPEPVDEYFGNSAFRWMHHFAIYVGHSFYGATSSAISVNRSLNVKHSRFMNEHGDWIKGILIFITFLTPVIPVVFGIFNDQYGTVRVMDLTADKSPLYREYVLEYKLAFDKTDDFSIWIKISFALLMIFAISQHLAKAVSYLMLIHYLYKHDNFEMKNIITADQIKSRNKRNFTTLFGCVLEDVYTSIFFVISILVNIQFTSMTAHVAIDFVGFATQSWMSILASPYMRKQLLNKLKQD